MLAALDGDTFIEMDGKHGNPTTGTWTQTDAFLVNQWWTPDASGAGFAKSDTYPSTFYGGFDDLINVFIPDSTQTSLIPNTNARVKLIKLVIGGSGSWNNEIAFVDEVRLDGNLILDDITEDRFTWVNSDTNIYFTCTDQLPHPSEEEEVCFKVSYDYPQWGYITETYCEPENMTDDGYCCVPATPQTPFRFNFNEDSMHNLEYYCIDAVEKKSDEYIQYYKVDTDPPTTEKTYNPAVYIDSATSYEYIDTVHEIELTATDNGEICHIGVDEKRYRVSGALADRFCENCAGWMTALRPAMGPWNTYTGPFGIDEESCHIIEYSSVDLLGNEEKIQWQCVFVDKTGPEITKTYSGPQLQNNFVGRKRSL